MLSAKPRVIELTNVLELISKSPTLGHPETLAEGSSDEGALC